MMRKQSPKTKMKSSIELRSVTLNTTGMIVCPLNTCHMTEAIQDLTGRALSPEAKVAKVEGRGEEGSLMGGSETKEYCTTS